MSDTPKQNDWSKPAAMAIPKGGFFKLEQGRYGPIFPKTPACYGFSILAKIKPGRERPSASMARRSRKPWPSRPTASPCSNCITCAGCCSTSKATPTSCIRASSTPTSTSIPRMPWRSSRQYRHHDGIRESRGLPRGLENERARVHQVRPGTPMPELPGIRRIPVCERR